METAEYWQNEIDNTNISIKKRNPIVQEIVQIKPAPNNKKQWPKQKSS